MANSTRQTGMRLYSRRGERLYLNSSEAARFLAVAANRREDMRLLATILYFTGIRLSEARGITSADIQCEAGVIAIRSLKKRHTDHIREVPIPMRLSRDLCAYCQNRPPRSPLFPHDRSTLWRWMHAIMVEAGITGTQACPKGLRHGFGVRAVLAGVPLPVLQKWLGHARLETTTIYTGIIGPEERQLAERMFGQIGG